MPCLVDKKVLTRSEVLCLLCHMTLCSLKKRPQHPWWITFEIWLRDGQCCAIAYLHTLFVYFSRSFAAKIPLCGEIVFQKKVSGALPLDVLKQCTFSSVEVKLDGAIGDLPLPEVDFANKNIGYGKTGTQEEMIFGSTPELCVAMLFCEAMKDNEAIFMSGAFKVAELSGYGLDVSSFITFLSFLSSGDVSPHLLWERLKHCEVKEGEDLFLHLQTKIESA
ncbi:uncharacterized protein LOC129585844 [Paramacrobiotus metropolitanus]|uniref:uncharacterized protein LOC129585844 n=1 Tax=Paramacrobiotus metropolitanus TaxID=2943436 RepID=UPI0024460EF0|nr:uncharacterized protein LOC129585844 [Paramacrobiotus metropolitanus]